MSQHTQREPFPPRWAFLVLAVVIIVGLGWTVYNQVSATADKNTAQSNAATLAQDIQTMCANQGKLMVDDRDLCVKGEAVLQNPTGPIPGPKGDQGAPGKDGVDGATGPAGATGPTGPAGEPGKSGADSTAPGPAGKDGAASTIPGPQGPAGKDGAPGPTGPQGPAGEPGAPGADGANGKPAAAPSSFTFTYLGTPYTCTPNPPGSSNYTCTSGGIAP